MKRFDELDASRLGMSVASRMTRLSAGQVIVVTSARRREGKSFVSHLLAKELSKTLATDLVLVDAAEQTRDQGPKGRIESKLFDTGFSRLIAQGELPPVEPATSDEPRIFFLSGGHQLKTSLFSVSGVSRAFGVLRGNFKITLIDAPVLTECGALLSSADSVLLVMDSKHTSPSEVKRAMAAAQLDPARVMGVLLNRAPAAAEAA